MTTSDAARKSGSGRLPEPALQASRWARLRAEWRAALLAALAAMPGWSAVAAPVSAQTAASAASVASAAVSTTAHTVAAARVPALRAGVGLHRGQCIAAVARADGTHTVHALPLTPPCFIAQAPARVAGAGKGDGDVWVVVFGSQASATVGSPAEPRCGATQAALVLGAATERLSPRTARGLRLCEGAAPNPKEAWLFAYPNSTR